MKPDYSLNSRQKSKIEEMLSNQEYMIVMKSVIG